MDRWLVLSCIVLGVVLATLTVYFFWPEPCGTRVTCESDEQCGGNIIGEQYCRDGNLYGNGQVNVCENAGKCNAQCVTSYASVLIEKCENGCENGACVLIAES